MKMTFYVYVNFSFINNYMVVFLFDLISSAFQKIFEHVYVSVNDCEPHLAIYCFVYEICVRLLKKKYSHIDQLIHEHTS